MSVAAFTPISRIASDDTESLMNFNMTLRGTGLTLTDGNAAVEGEGHLRVYIDGNDQFGRIESGNLTNGLNTDAIDISGLAVGPHRIRVRAFYSNGDPYPNPSSSAGRQRQLRSNSCPGSKRKFRSGVRKSEY